MRVTGVLLLMGLAFVLLLPGCSPAGRISDRDVQPVDARTLERLMADEPGLVVVDVRSERRFAEGHLPGALHIPLAELRGDEPELEAASLIVVYAQEARQSLSTAAAKKLLRAGRPEVRDFRAGFEQWRERGYEVAQP